ILLFLVGEGGVVSHHSGTISPRQALPESFDRSSPLPASLPVPPSYFLNDLNEPVAGVKWDPQRQILETSEVFYFEARVGGYPEVKNRVAAAARWVSQAGIGVRLVDKDLDALRNELETFDPNILVPHPDVPNWFSDTLRLGDLKATRHWFGRSKPRGLQLEIEIPGSNRPVIAQFLGGDQTSFKKMELLLQPKVTVLVNGPGTIGAKVLKWARRHGFWVLAAKRTANDKETRRLADEGVPLVALKGSDKAAFEKEGLPLFGTLEETLAGGGVDIVVDTADGETKDADGNTLSVTEYNLKYIYNRFPDVAVVIQGGEAQGMLPLFETTNFTRSGDFRQFRGKSVQVTSCNTHSTNRVVGPALFHYPRIDGLELHLFRRTADATSAGNGMVDNVAMQAAGSSLKYWKAVQGLYPPSLWEKIQADPTTNVTEGSHTHFHAGYVRIKAPGITAKDYARLLQRERTRTAVIGITRFRSKGRFNTGELFGIQQDALAGDPHLFLTPVAVVDVQPGIPGSIDIHFATPQESNVVPDNINALHAIAGTFNGTASIGLVDQVMSIDLKKGKMEHMMPDPNLLTPRDETSL
ncbi:MAG: hypothetical protein HYS56_06205, partial [Candidatus Omnitrophica bacterium]|nr:hypothetical protein [Candidatus Omnitrophota bacterium]